MAFKGPLSASQESDGQGVWLKGAGLPSFVDIGAPGHAGEGNLGAGKAAALAGEFAGSDGVAAVAGVECGEAVGLLPVGSNFGEEPVGGETDGAGEGCPEGLAEAGLDAGGGSAGLSGLAPLSGELAGEFVDGVDFVDRDVAVHLGEDLLMHADAGVVPGEDELKLLAFSRGLAARKRGGIRAGWEWHVPGKLLVRRGAGVWVSALRYLRFPAGRGGSLPP